MDTFMEDMLSQAEIDALLSGLESFDESGSEVEIIAEFGRTEKTNEEILSIARGSIIRLDTIASEPITVLANGKAVGKGEIVDVDGKFGVRITKLDR